MTFLDLDAIKARAGAATEGPWLNYGGENYAIISAPEIDELAHVGSTNNDAEFIAHARTDVPALLAEVERLRQVVALVHGVVYDMSYYDAKPHKALYALHRVFEYVDDGSRVDGTSDSSSTGSQS